MNTAAVVSNDVISRQELEYAIAHNMLVPFAQKQFCIKTNRVVGLEVLCRWHREQCEWVSPEVFIPLVDEYELHQEFNTWLFHQSFAQLSPNCRQRLSDTQQTGEPVRISFNLSAKHLKNLMTFQSLINSCRYFDISPNCVNVEVTEDAIINEIGQCREVLTLLQSLGVHISLDDFGKGYSMFQQLMSFSFDSLKLDKCFAKSLRHDERVLFMLEALVLLANRAKMDLVLEGIESLEQHKLIKMQGVAYAQGFYYHKPEPLSQLSLE